jgi:acyl transferase domain-containing protein/thioesterase domain-containing protein
MDNSAPPDGAWQRRALLAIDELNAKVERLEHERSESIAIIGMGCRFPGGANDLDAYWNVLRDGRDAISEVPPDRWGGPDLDGKIATRYAGFLKDVDVAGFDPGFFGLSPREAAAMDPQQRLALEVVWEAIEHAAIPPRRLAGSATGVFLGLFTNDYLLKHARRTSVDTFMLSGTAFSAAAGRVSYLLGFEGPCVAVDTACSSSLVAVHLACQSLLRDECTQALAGGVNLLLEPPVSICCSKGGFLAPDGHCKTFDARADGYARAEGAGIVVLKRLSHALRDGDRVLAVIRGSAVNQDGRTNGFTAPSGKAQQAVIHAALERGRVRPDEVSVVEAHGTGTPLGDPIELEAIGAVLCDRRPADRPLIVGSAKSVIGHCEAAAGVAGLIKMVLALQNETVPPNLGFHEPSPHIPWDRLAVKIPTKPTAWVRGATPRIGGVSSFGFSGTNAHVVVAEGPPLGATAPARRGAHLLPLSARTGPALRDQGTRLLAHLRNHPDEPLADVCFTAAAGRRHFEHRLTILGGTPAEMIARLEARLRAELPEPITAAPRLAFVFTGQGAQVAGMGRDLYEREPCFRAILDRCAAVLEPLLDKPLLGVMFEGGDGALDQTAYTQPALYALECALVDLWASWGVRPEVVLGHSVGEFAAAYAAGVFTLEDGARLVAERGRLIQSLPAGGILAAIVAGADSVRAALDGAGREVHIATVNGPEATVVGGHREAVRRFVERLGARGVRARELRVSHAFHTPLMDPILDEFERVAAQIAMKRPEVTFVSNLSGGPVRELGAAYWRRHLREPVRFDEGVRALADSTTFLEIGPGRTLLGLAQSCLPGAKARFIPSLQRGASEDVQILEARAGLYAAGVEIDWTAFHGGGRRRVALPTYPFQRRRCWIDDIDEHEVAPLELTAPEWRERELGGEARSAAGERWLILADEGGVGAGVALALQARGATCALVPCGAEVDWHNILGGRPWHGILYMWALDAMPLGALTPARLDAAQRLGVHGLLGLIQALARRPSGPPIWVVTRDAEGPTTSAPGLAQAPLWGFCRGVAAEHPELFGGLIDVGPTDGAAAVADELGRRSRDRLVAYRAGRRFVARRARLAMPARGRFAARPDGTYLVTGGLGELGLLVARWLVERGARRLVLIGRAGLVPRSSWDRLTPNHAQAPAVAAVRAMEKLGAAVSVFPVDVADADAMRHLRAVLDDSLPPIRGVVHAAGALADSALRDLEGEQLERALRPKLRGSWILHELFGRDLDFFVLFSSATATVASHGQANYAAANAFLDALSRHRRALGLAATSIQWGAWASPRGMAAGLEHSFERRGIHPFAPASGLDALDRLLGAAPTEASAGHFDWGRVQELSTALGPVFEELVREPVATVDSPEQLLQRLQRESDATRRDVLCRHVREIVAHVLQIETHAIAPTTSLLGLGLDSIGSMEIVAGLRRSLGLKLDPGHIMARASVQQLADYVATRIGGGETLASNIVAIQPHGSRPPLFCLHPAGGEVFTYRPLAGFLGSDQPLYAVRSTASEGGGREYMSVEQMAAAYADAIRTVQPSGPYHLLGFSFGAPVAHAVAAELEARHEKVAFLGLWDAPPSLPLSDGLETLEALIGLVPALHGPLARALEMLDQDDRHRFYAGLAGLPAEVARQRALDVICDRAVPFDAPPQDLISRQELLVRHHLDIWGLHEPGVVAAPLTVAWARQRFGVPRGDWRPFTTAGCIETEIGGNHFTMFLEPAFAELARLVGAALATVATVERRRGAAEPRGGQDGYNQHPLHE